MSDAKKVFLGFATIAVMYAMAALLSCYDRLHPPATPGGDPSDYPPLTDSKKVDGGHD